MLTAPEDEQATTLQPLLVTVVLPQVAMLPQHNLSVGNFPV